MAPLPGEKTTGTTQILTANEIAWLVKQYVKGLFGENALKPFTQHIMVAIALAESGGNSQAHNTKGADDSYGLWQINMKGSLGPARRRLFSISADTALLNPHTNAKAANIVLVQQGLGAWTTYTSGAYKKYMDAATTGMNSPKAPSQMPGIGGRLEGDGSDPVGDFLSTMFDPVFDFLKQAGLRTAGFVGGVALIAGAVVLVAKKGVKA